MEPVAESQVTATWLGQQHASGNGRPQAAGGARLPASPCWVMLCTGTGVLRETKATLAFLDNQPRLKTSSSAEDRIASSSRAAPTTNVTCSIQPIACCLHAPSRLKTRTFHWLPKPRSTPLAKLSRRGGAQSLRTRLLPANQEGGTGWRSAGKPL